VIIAVPAERPVTRPIVEITGATSVLLLLQAPPVVASARVLVPLTQMVVVPVMGAGLGKT